jgi:hypothetical protein
VKPKISANDSPKLPHWLTRFIRNETQSRPDNEQILLAIFKPMSPTEWCLLWIPVMHPDVELPCPGERNPQGYMKACIKTLSTLIRYGESTVEKWFYGYSYHHSVGILLRCLHLIFKLQRFLARLQ